MKLTWSLCLALALSSAAMAEQTAPAHEMSPEEKAMMAAGAVGPQHAHLKGMEGTWNTKVSMWMDPSKPDTPSTTTGKAVNTPIMEGRFIETRYTGDFMGQPFTGIGYTGYDNLRKKHVASWMDSMSTGMYVTYGSYDDASKTFTYSGDMPDMMAPEKSIPIRQTVKIDSADQHTMSWHETRDGKEIKTMEIVYTRAK